MDPTVPASRGDAATRVLRVLARACEEGEAALIGSLAIAGRADAWSDVDVRWTLPPEQVARQLRSLRRLLEQVGAVESLRVDPAGGDDVRLVFVRFTGWPLWWRVDLEVRCRGAGSLEVPGADPWSPHESAAMGVLVALKALARGRADAADELLGRAAGLVGAPDAVGDWRRRTDALLDHVEATGPATADLVARVRRLSREVLEP